MKYGKLNDSPFWVSLQQRTDLAIHGNLNAALYALELHNNIADIVSLAPEIITEGGDDENIDLLYVDLDSASVYVIQSFQSPLFREQGARPNKARDSSYAVMALSTMTIEDIPNRIREQVVIAREAIQSDLIKNLYIWFVHNCPETDECKRIMDGIGTQAATMLRGLGKSSIIVDASEVGLETLDQLYKSQQNAILISDVIETPKNAGFVEYSDTGWTAFSTSVTASFLKNLYSRYGEDKLFSANVRSYMGSNNKDQAINGQIKKSALETPSDFYVCNNGITALVHDFEVKFPSEDDKNLGRLLNITGISIVNGAQTTGCLSTNEQVIDPRIKVAIRFIKVNDDEKVRKITLANNSQNKVLASDFRSGDEVQSRLRSEFERVGDAFYTGGLRKILTPAQKRILIDPETLAQVLTAFHGHPTSSYHQKTEIWEKDELYNIAFNATITSRHILFIYSLYEAIVSYKNDIAISNRHGNLLEQDKPKHEFLSKPGVSFIVIHAVASIIEMIVGKVIPNKYSLSFRDDINREQSIQLWENVIKQVVKRTVRLLPATDNRLSQRAKITEIMDNFREDMDMFRDNFNEWFPDLIKAIKL
ncbi:AIPR family protein [Rheinheimera tilapiae]|uniref:AIPR family protein n=1 Tax=Rheinheimera tilapiae TaxID=875043 RepID=A0ABV6B9U5_9GAMM